jgi:hypothetical protein
MIYSRAPLSALALLVSTISLSSCGIDTEESITFDNPFCQDVDATFTITSSGTSTSQAFDVENVIRDDYVLREISIKDAEKLKISSIHLLAPDGTVFYYPEPGPDTARLFEETLTPTSIIYTASNIKYETSIETPGGAEVPSGDPTQYAEKHLGSWELTITYLHSDLPEDAVDAGLIHKTFEICFPFDE